MPTGTPFTGMLTASLRSLMLGSAMALAVTGTVFAQDAPASCGMTPSQAADLASTQNYDVVSYKDLNATDEGTKALLQKLRETIAGISGKDPDEVVQFDALMLFNTEAQETAWGIAFKDGCMVTQGPIPKEIFDSLKMAQVGS